MFRSTLTRIVMWFAIAGCCASVQAQSSTHDATRPRSDVGGYAGNELRSIYREDIGQGYSGQSLNQIALQNAQARVPYVGQSSAGIPQSGPGTSLTGLGLTRQRSAKPFSSISSTPTVSPYLNLFREDFDGSSDFNYQTLVRPQIQQQQYNQQFERQNLELSRRVQAISAQSPYRNQAGSEQQYPTGHKTVFRYYGSFYPGMSAQPRR